MKRTTFPKDFLWGASTAAHQVEGGTHNQWSEWERATAERSAGRAERLLGPGGAYGEGIDWENIKAQASDPANYISGDGVEHYQRYKEDFELLKSLHMNALRFGIEWSRIEPEEGKWDEAAIRHYHDYIAELRRQGIEPILTLWHWTMPTWFAAKGGFEKKENLRHFYDYVQKCGEAFGHEVRYVLTLNEPNVYALISYMRGEWPPEQKSTLLGLKVYRHLMQAHRESYKILKRCNPDLQISLAANLGESKPLQPHNPWQRLAARFRDYVWNWWFLNRARGSLDFIGVNYYFTSYVDGRMREQNPSAPRNDLGWYMEPAGLGRVLTRAWQRYRLPLIVVENGLADAADTQRQWWLEESIGAMEEALQAGAELKGYLHWSLLDNFEWAYGWWPEFGLIRVDRKTMQRTVRPSAEWFAAEIKRRTP